jgi:hypothetical protein
MAKEPDDLVLRHLRDLRGDISGIRQTQIEHSGRFDRIEKALDDLSKLVTYSLGQSTQTQFRQTQQEARIDELFDKLEQLLSGKEPV